ncbi:putative ammonium transporter 2 isoform X2 [Bacillus rossius redtenbacheri]|uniref:putative ammonium transporter 2 isoform X2 n=1 Tax=Bacillus rossius redtenbacheri TaxID=93214 RepID=UPI002FDCEDE0
MEGNGTNASQPHARVPSILNLNLEDTNWVMTSSFIIFTMQTGFGMLESGCVSVKNEVNIMMKNVVDVALGGLTYWAFGFAMSFGRSPLNNPFTALGDFLVDPAVEDPLMGPISAAFLFQLSFATTATTIVSGAMAERCNFKAYCIFSLLNTIVYCIPAGWVWGEHGFLNQMGVVDIAGSGPVHLIGGCSALVSAAMLGPRLGRYADGKEPLPPGTPVNAVMGLFVLWWGWLGFNSGRSVASGACVRSYALLRDVCRGKPSLCSIGRNKHSTRAGASTYGVSGAKWEYAARAAVMTMLASFGGGCMGLAYSLVTTQGRLDILVLINGILGSLVAITAGCFLYRAWEALLIGAVGSAITCVSMPMFDALGIDDPVGASSVHGMASIWGVLAVGLFADNPRPLQTTSGRSGLFKGGGWYMLGVQSLSVLCLSTWAITTNYILLWFTNKIVPIRMDPMSELLGADLVEHRIRHAKAGISRIMSAVKPFPEEGDLRRVPAMGCNPGHDAYVMENYYNSIETKVVPTKTNVNMGITKDTFTMLDSLGKGSELPPRFAWLD